MSQEYRSELEYQITQWVRAISGCLAHGEIDRASRLGDCIARNRRTLNGRG